MNLEKESLLHLPWEQSWGRASTLCLHCQRSTHRWGGSDAVTACAEQEGALLPYGANPRAWAEAEQGVLLDLTALYLKCICLHHLISWRNKVVWTYGWWTGVYLSDSSGSRNCWPFLASFKSSQTNSNLIMTSYKLKKNIWQIEKIEKRELLILPWGGGGHIKCKNIGTVWMWSCQTETSSGKGPSP